MNLHHNHYELILFRLRSSIYVFFATRKMCTYIFCSNFLIMLMQCCNSSTQKSFISIHFWQTPFEVFSRSFITSRVIIIENPEFCIYRDAYGWSLWYIHLYFTRKLSSCTVICGFKEYEYFISHKTSIASYQEHT